MKAMPSRSEQLDDIAARLHDLADRVPGELSPLARDLDADFHFLLSIDDEPEAERSAEGLRAPCPCAGCFGRVFRDARGGYECTECDARFVVGRQPPQGYGGPQGPLSWLEQLRARVARAIWPG